MVILNEFADLKYVQRSSQGSSYLYVCILNFILPLNILSHEMDTNFEIHVRENTGGSINTRHFLKSWF